MPFPHSGASFCPPLFSSLFWITFWFFYLENQSINLSWLHFPSCTTSFISFNMEKSLYSIYNISPTIPPWTTNIRLSFYHLPTISVQVFIVFDLSAAFATLNHPFLLKLFFSLICWTWYSRDFLGKVCSLIVFFAVFSSLPEINILIFLGLNPWSSLLL